MAQRNVVKLGDEVLRKVSKPVKDFNESLWQLLDDMKETMHSNDGMGLAAVQVGVLKRVVVMEVNGAFFEMVNPKITAQSEELIEDEEGCLSVPKQHGIVARPQWVTVQFQDRYGFSMAITGEEAFARCVCHELDHLEGVLYIDKTVKKSKK